MLGRLRHISKGTGRGAWRPQDEVSFADNAAAVHLHSLSAICWSARRRGKKRRKIRIKKCLFWLKGIPTKATLWNINAECARLLIASFLCTPTSYMWNAKPQFLWVQFCLKWTLLRSRKYFRLACFTAMNAIQRMIDEITISEPNVVLISS